MAEEATEEKKDIKLSKEAKGVLDALKKMSLMEVADLVKAMEDEFGVSAAAPVAMAAPAGGGGGDAAGGAEEKTAFTVELTETGGQKIAVIKAVREITGLGLKEAKDIVDAAPKPVLENVAKDKADEAQKALEAAGATVTIK